MDKDDSPKVNQSSSAETVSNNDDLLNEILLRLPIPSLLRFESVSKRWLSLITHPNFVRLRTRTLTSSPSGLFLQSFFPDPFTRESHFIPLNLNCTTPFSTTATNPLPIPLAFVENPSPRGLRILQSCNGLLLCQGLDNFYLYNPTTNRFTTLPRPRGLPKVLYAVNLAFDPLNSPSHYKLVSVFSSNKNTQNTGPVYFDFDIFSSETRLWTPSSANPPPTTVDFANSVFWNGSLHWTDPCGGDSLYFEIDEKRFGIMPMPPWQDGWQLMRKHRYFGVSRDHLHLIELYGPPTKQFNVYEMERDYSAWFVKYRVDLDPILNAFPEMICSSALVGPPPPPAELHYYGFSLLRLVPGENDEEDPSFVVLHIPGKIMRYNFQDNSFIKLFDVPPSRHDNDGALKYRGWFDAFEYIESLALV